MTELKASADMENNAELFWDSLRGKLTEEFRLAEPELYDLCRDLVDEGTVLIGDPKAAERFTNFVADIPGWADGPAYAREALILEAL